ncbi:MAG TPA: glycosyltransferase family 1 protein [Solirubrobacteraceae bacterium]
MAPASGSTRPRPILLNRRAATRPTITGVERWTAEVIPRLWAHDPERYAIVEPPPRARRRAAAQGWEQTALPARAALMRAGLIFSPANLAPLLWPRNVLVVHDAAVLREPGAYSRAYRMWHRYAGLTCARRALRVITVSEFSRRELTGLVGLDPARVVVIGGGVSESFHPGADAGAVARRLGLERPYVLTIATDDRRKNLPALAETAVQLGGLGIELVHAGDTRPYFAAAGDEGAMRSLGYVADADLPGLYAGARAFVLPSRYEGFGLTCLEAMASGVPVVAADRAALPETCGDAAELVDPDDTAALAAAVVRAAIDEELRSRLRAAGLRRAAQFTWERAARDVHELLRALTVSS